MAISADELIYPAGEILPSWFKDGEDPAAIIGEWLTQLPATTADTAAPYYIYARAYRLVANRIASGPIEHAYGGAGGNRERYDRTQIAHWTSLAEDAEAKAEEIQSGETTAATKPSGIGRVISTF